MKTLQSLILCAVVIFFPACLSTDTGNIKKDRFNAVANVLMNKGIAVLGQVAVSAIAGAASQDGGNTDWQHTIASTAWTSAKASITAEDFQNVLAAATLNHAPATVNAATAQLAVAKDNGIPTKDAVVAIGNIVSALALKKG